MGAELDLDDVAATSPLAQRELAELRADLAHARADIERLSVDLAEAQREIQRLREATTILANGSLLPDPGVYDRLDPEMREIICKHLHEYLD